MQCAIAVEISGFAFSVKRVIERIRLILNGDSVVVGHVYTAVDDVDALLLRVGLDAETTKCWRLRQLHLQAVEYLDIV